MRTTDYERGPIPKGVAFNADALLAAYGWAEHLESLGAKIKWIRGMSTYDPMNDWHIARGDVLVFGPDGVGQQLGADFVSPTPAFDRAIYPAADDFGRIYRIGIWNNAVRNALEKALPTAFPRYRIALDSSLEIAIAYRENGSMLHDRHIPRRIRGYIAGFIEAWKITAPHPDTAQTPPEEAAHTLPLTAQPEPKP